jgi:exopolyphosphatase/guanosine-5'-triphosphate,3'-diphosphate pyrophosphatase
MIRWVSLPLGSVRFTEKFLTSDPVQEKEWEKMVKEIRRWLVKIPHPEEPYSMVAVAGTATTLAAVEQGLKEFVPEKIHRFVLRQEALKKQLLLYRSKMLDERKKIPGLSPARADVILAGGAILYEAMKELQRASALISVHGVRYGVLYKKIAP